MPLDEAWVRQHIANAPPITRPRKPKPKPAEPAVLAPVSERMAAAVKANPQSLRLSAKGDDGVTVIKRPDQRRPLSHVQVIEVDAEGRPLLAQTYDPTTNTFGLVKYEGGYGLPTPREDMPSRGVGAKHEYDPLDALRGRDDD